MRRVRSFSDEPGSMGVNGGVIADVGSVCRLMEERRPPSRSEGALEGGALCMPLLETDRGDCTSRQCFDTDGHLRLRRDAKESRACSPDLRRLECL
jgi:hypothetical protein